MIRKEEALLPIIKMLVFLHLWINSLGRLKNLFLKKREQQHQQRAIMAIVIRCILALQLSWFTEIPRNKVYKKTVFMKNYFSSATKGWKVLIL